MSSKILINAVDPEECRIAIVKDSKLEEFHIETAAREKIHQQGEGYLSCSRNKGRGGSFHSLRVFSLIDCVSTTYRPLLTHPVKKLAFSHSSTSHRLTQL